MPAKAPLICTKPSTAARTNACPQFSLANCELPTILTMTTKNISRLVRRAGPVLSLSAPCLGGQYRQFHSYDHVPSQDSKAAAESILTAAYKHIPDNGFTQKSIILGAHDAGFLDISSSILSDGPFSLINYHLVKQRRSLARSSSDLAQDAGSRCSPEERLVELTWRRLLANKDVIHQWQEVRSYSNMSSQSLLIDSHT